MYRHAVSSAGKPNSSRRAPRMAAPSFRERTGRCSMPSVYEAYAARQKAAVQAIFRRRDAKSDFGAFEVHPSRIPSSARGHASGLSGARRQARSSASAAPPSGLRFPSATDPP